MNMLKNVKRTLATLLSAILMLPAIASSPVSAQTGITTYEYEGYSVAYNVVNEWAGNQSIEVKITNTGTEPILNWALRYDATGVITGLWSGIALENSNTEYIIRNQGYNYEIAPNQSVNFGYNLAGETLSLPRIFKLCSNRADVPAESYTTSLNILEQWDTGFKAELILTNISTSPLEAWKLAFDGSFTLTDLWNAKLLETTGTNTISTDAKTTDGNTISNESETSETNSIFR